MRLPHLKLVWTPRHLEADWRLGLFGSVRRADGKPPTLAVSLRGVLLTGLALAGAAYLAGAWALLTWLDRRSFNFVTYADLVLPTHWPRLEALRGEANIREGLDAYKDKRWSEALQKLQAGLSRDPDTTLGRPELAFLLLALNDRHNAEEVLFAGLKPGFPGRPYLAELCRLAGQGENYDLWLQACDTALAQLAGQPLLAADRQWVVRQKLSALLAAGRNDEALRFAGAEGATQSDVMREFKLLALLKAGQPAAAVDFLADWRAHATGSAELEQVRRLQARTFREADRPDDMDRVLDELRAADPGGPAPYAYAVIQRLLAGRRAEAEATFQDYLQRFSGKAANLLLLAEPLGEIAEEPLLGRLLDSARAQGFSLLGIQRQMVAAAMKNGHWSVAADRLADMKPNLPRNDPSALLWLNLMNRTVAAALDPSEGVQDSLISLLGERHLMISLYRDTAAGLRQAGRLATARRVLTLAVGVFPDNANLRESAADLDRAIALLPKPAAPAPSAAALVGSGGETPFFAALAATMQQGDAAKALAQIQAARSARPAWLAAHDEELRRDEILLAARLHDTTGMTAFAGLFLDGDDARSLAVVDLARQLHNGDTLAESVQLLQAVLRKNPGYQSASRLLSAWTPAVPPAAPVAAVATAGPPPPIPAVNPPPPARPPAAGEDEFFKTLATTMLAGDHAAALAQIVGVRAARPAWLAAHDEELRGDEILLNGRLHDEVAMLTGLRLFLNGGTARSLAALELAKQLHAGDSVPESLLVVQEVLRKTPAFPPATRLLATWQPPAPAK